MFEEPTSPNPIQMSLWADFPVSRSPMPATSEEPTTPDISGRKCSELSGNSGPLGLLERTLLDSRDWAWTKYSLIWRPRATPRGRLIFQLARLAPRTSDSDSGLLHTPTAKANQTSPSMETRGRGNWVSSLGGAKPHHMVPTPTSQDHIERESTNKTPSTGKLNYETNKSVSLDRWARMWPTPNARMAHGHQTNLGDAVKLWQTPVADDSVERTDGKWNSRGEPKLSAQVKLWPTPSSREPGWKNIEVVDRYGRPPTHHNQRFYDKKTGRVVQKGLPQTVTDPKSGGTLNPQWVAWLMGYPPEYFDSVPWETRSSRKSRNK